MSARLQVGCLTPPPIVKSCLRLCQRHTQYNNNPQASTCNVVQTAFQYLKPPRRVPLVWLCYRRTDRQTCRIVSQKWWEKQHIIGLLQRANVSGSTDEQQIRCWKLQKWAVFAFINFKNRVQAAILLHVSYCMYCVVSFFLPASMPRAGIVFGSVCVSVCVSVRTKFWKLLIRNWCNFVVVGSWWHLTLTFDLESCFCIFWFAMNTSSSR